MAKVTRTPGPGQAKLEAALKGIDNKVGKVGWFATAHYQDGTPVALVAAVNEFGWPEHNIPPRLGMRATADAMRAVWGTLATTLAHRVLDGNMTGAEMMEALGLKAAGDIRKHISKVTSPPLKTQTVMARLRGKKQGNVVSITVAKPLVHTGLLLNSLTNTVEDKK